MKLITFLKTLISNWRLLLIAALLIYIVYFKHELLKKDNDRLNTKVECVQAEKNASELQGSINLIQQSANHTVEISNERKEQAKEIIEKNNELLHANMKLEKKESENVTSKNDAYDRLVNFFISRGM